MEILVPASPPCGRPAAIKSTLSQVPDSCEISSRIIIPSEIKGLKFRGGARAGGGGARWKIILMLALYFYARCRPSIAPFTSVRAHPARPPLNPLGPQIPLYSTLFFLSCLYSSVSPATTEQTESGPPATHGSSRAPTHSRTGVEGVDGAGR